MGSNNTDKQKILRGKMDTRLDYKISDKDIQSSKKDDLMKQFMGKWKFVKKENFDEFLKACGILWPLRKAANALTPTEIFECTNREKSKYLLKTETIVKSAMAEFNLEEEFIETTIDGRKMKTTFDIVNISPINIETGMEINPTSEIFALLQSQIDCGGRTIQVLRFLQDGLLKVIMKVNDTIGRALFEPEKTVS